MDMSTRFSTRFRKKTCGLLPEMAGGAPEEDYVNLSSADPFAPQRPLPDSVQQAIAKHLADPYVAHYGEALGNRQLRETIAARLERKYQYPIDPSRNILITPGSEPGLMASISLFVEDGDEVLIPDPSYSTNFTYVACAGGKPVSVPLDEESGYSLSIHSFEERLTPRTKAVLLTHPNNPTGRVYNRESLETLCRFIVEHELFLICDMAFEDYIFDELEFLWPATLPEMWERTLTIFTASKGFGLCGLRVGYIVADMPMLDALLAETTPLLCSANSLAQIGFNAALQDETLLSEYRERLIRRRDKTWETLSQIPKIQLCLPQGGIQCWINVSALGTSQEICRYLREQARVEVTDGSSFGPLQGEGHIRLIYGCEDDDQRFDQALARMRDALLRYPES